MAEAKTSRSAGGGCIDQHGNSVSPYHLLWLSRKNLRRNRLAAQCGDGPGRHEKSRAREIASETGPRPHSRRSTMTLRTPCFSASSKRLRYFIGAPASSDGKRNTRMSGSAFWTMIFGVANFSRTRSTSSGVAFPRRMTATFDAGTGLPREKIQAWPTDMSRVVKPADGFEDVAAANASLGSRAIRKNGENDHIAEAFC